GRVKLERKQYDEAERYYREALALAENVDDKDGQASYMGSLGYLAFKREHWAEARKWSEKALMLATEIVRQDLIADIQHNLARVHEAEGRPDLALPLAQEALAIYERLQVKDLVEARELVERLMRSYPHP
ncbi:MAG: tetratricopeptide repeat protein, partial [Candidatus Methanoperedens sp.]|nr:tetratricopeptide repeat protein [Candidatus Methanoperedens sp.]